MVSVPQASSIQLGPLLPQHEPSVTDCLSEAIRNGDTAYFERLLSQHDSSALQQLDRQGLNPLHVAVIFGNESALKALLERREELELDIDIRSKEELSALHYAQKCKNEVAFRLLVASGCCVGDLLRKGPCDDQMRDSGSGVARDGLGESRWPTLAESETSGKHLLYPITDSYYWNVDVYREAIKKCYSELVDYTYPDLIIPALVEEGHLTMDEVERILKQDSKRNQTMLLLSILARKGQKAYHTFLRALKKEKEQKQHGELAKRLIQLCKDEVEFQCLAEHKDVESALGQTTTFYVGDQHEEMMPEHVPYNYSSSQSASRLLESGFHSASFTPNESRSASESNRKSTRSRRYSTSETRSHSHDRQYITHSAGRIVKQVSRNLINSALTNFRTDTHERRARPPLAVTEVTVPRREHRQIHTPTPASHGSSGGACFYANNMSPRPYTESNSDQESDHGTQENTNVLFDIPDESENDEHSDSEDQIEKDNTMPVLTKALSCNTSPIDIPSRSPSNSSILSGALSRKSSTDSNSSSVLPYVRHPSIDSLPSSPPKDLSSIPPARRPWGERLLKWLLKPNNVDIDSSAPSQFIGCKVF